MKIFAHDTDIHPFSKEWEIMKKHFKFIKEDTPLLIEIKYMMKERQKEDEFEGFESLVLSQGYAHIRVSHYPDDGDRRLSENGFTDAEKYEFSLLLEMFLVGIIREFYSNPEKYIQIASLAKNYIKEEYRKTFIEYAKLWVCFQCGICLEDQEKLKEISGLLEEKGKAESNEDFLL